MENLSVLLVGMKPEAEARLASALGQQQALRSVPDAAAARAVLRGARAPVAVVWLDGHPSSDTLSLVRELSGSGVAVVGVGAHKEADLILAALRAGVREYVVDREVEPLQRSVQQLLEASGALQLGKTTAVLGAKGGMGATTLAANMAGVFRQRDQRVCLADLDLELGDVLSFLDVRGSYAIADVAANARRLDRDLLDQSVPRHGSGIWVLSQAEKAAEAEGLGPESVAAVLRFLRTHYDQLVVDGVHGFGDVALAALDLADRIVLVVTQEVPAVRSAQRCAEILGRLGYEADRVLLVVNRFHKASTITTQVIEETVGLPVAATISNDFQALTRAVNRGVLLRDEAPRSPVVRDLEALCERLAPSGAPAEQPTGLKRFFARAHGQVGHGAE